MKTIWQNIKKIFKTLWWVLYLVRESIANLFIIFLFIMMTLFILFKYHHHKDINLKEPKDNSSSRVLLLDMHNKIIKDIKDIPSRTTSSPSKISNFFYGSIKKIIGPEMEDNPSIFLFDLVDAIYQAKNDPTISSIVLDLSDFYESDLGTLDYIGKALKEFRKSGKPVYSINNNFYSQTQYYLASYANKIYLSPSGVIFLHGFTLHPFYFKDLLDKFKLNPRIFRVGEYKSASEMFTRNDMSSHVRVEQEHLLNELWNHFIKVIAYNRHMTVQQIFPAPHEILKKLKEVELDAAMYAYQTKLVDGLKSEYDFNNEMIEKFGGNKDYNYYNHITIKDYILKQKNDQSKYTKLTNDNNNKIGVFTVHGPIWNKDGFITKNAYNTAYAMQKANQLPEYKGFLLYVDSPGGMEDPSQEIHDIIKEIRKSGKPVVVYMGQYAASGGYLISSAANYIIANPYTITGSIGVLSIVYPNLARTLANIGIHIRNISTSSFSTSPDVIPLFDELTPIHKEYMKIRIEKAYNIFVNLVASDRHLSPEYVDTIAQGKVWSATDAKKIGLIDAIGDFDDALSKVAELAKLKKWQMEWINDDENNNQSWLDNFIMSLIPFKLSSQLNFSYNNDFLNQEIMMLSESPSSLKIYAQCITCSNYQMD
ncbi:MAG: signal peptide peptidase SppA [Candidatus Dasytiphilus stammeri]